MNRLLLLGPLPPPLTGTPVSFEIAVEEISKHPEVESVEVVDSSPKWLKQGNRTGWGLPNPAEARQALRILRDFSAKSGRCDVAVLFAGNASVITLLPLLSMVCRFRRVRCYFRLFGGSMDQYLDSLSPLVRRVAEATLRRLDGLIVETALLEGALTDRVAPVPVSLVPGYRPAVEHVDRGGRTGPSTPLRLVFVGIVKQSKGVFTLLDALESLEPGIVICEFVGEINEPDRERFESRVAEIEGVTYRGVVDWREVPDLLGSHDCLVLPTDYIGEGHPGVIIEAMMVGIPTITTCHRAIPELIDHDRNGLLVDPGDAGALAHAIREMTDRDRWARLSEAAAADSERYTSMRVIDSLVQVVTCG